MLRLEIRRLDGRFLVFDSIEPSTPLSTILSDILSETDSDPYFPTNNPSNYRFHRDFQLLAPDCVLSDLIRLPSDEGGEEEEEEEGEVYGVLLWLVYVIPPQTEPSDDSPSTPSVQSEKGFNIPFVENFSELTTSFQKTHTGLQTLAARVLGNIVNAIELRSGSDSDSDAKKDLVSEFRATLGFIKKRLFGQDWRSLLDELTLELGREDEEEGECEEEGEGSGSDSDERGEVEGEGEEGVELASPRRPKLLSDRSDAGGDSVSSLASGRGRGRVRMSRRGRRIRKTKGGERRGRRKPKWRLMREDFGEGECEEEGEKEGEGECELPIVKSFDSDDGSPAAVDAVVDSPPSHGGESGPDDLLHITSADPVVTHLTSAGDVEGDSDPEPFVPPPEIATVGGETVVLDWRDPGMGWDNPFRSSHDGLTPDVEVPDLGIDRLPVSTDPGVITEEDGESGGEVEVDVNVDVERKKEEKKLAIESRAVSSRQRRQVLAGMEGIQETMGFFEGLLCVVFLVVHQRQQAWKLLIMLMPWVGLFNALVLVGFLIADAIMTFILDMAVCPGKCCGSGKTFYSAFEYMLEMESSQRQRKGILAVRIVVSSVLIAFAIILHIVLNYETISQPHVYCGTEPYSTATSNVTDFSSFWILSGVGKLYFTPSLEGQVCTIVGFSPFIYIFNVILAIVFVVLALVRRYPEFVPYPTYRRRLARLEAKHMHLPRIALSLNRVVAASFDQVVNEVVLLLHWMEIIDAKSVEECRRNALTEEMDLSYVEHLTPYEIGLLRVVLLEEEVGNPFISHENDDFQLQDFQALRKLDDEGLRTVEEQASVAIRPAEGGACACPLFLASSLIPGLAVGFVVLGAICLLVEVSLMYFSGIVSFVDDSLVIRQENFLPGLLRGVIYLVVVIGGGLCLSGCVTFVILALKQNNLLIHQYRELHQDALYGQKERQIRGGTRASDRCAACCFAFSGYFFLLLCLPFSCFARFVCCCCPGHRLKSCFARFKTFCGLEKSKKAYDQQELDDAKDDLQYFDEDPPCCGCFQTKKCCYQQWNVVKKDILREFLLEVVGSVERGATMTVRENGESKGSGSRNVEEVTRNQLKRAVVDPNDRYILDWIEEGSGEISQEIQDRAFVFGREFGRTVLED